MNKPLLTKKRQAWVDTRNSHTFKGTTLQYNASQQEKYVKALTSLVSQMTAQTMREVKSLYSGQANDSAMDDNISSQARILTNKLKGKFTALFARKAKGLADQMVQGANKASKSALHRSLKELSGGLSLKTSMIDKNIWNVMNATVVENVSLIKSIADEYLTNVQGAVMRSITTGNGLQDLIPQIEKFQGDTHRRAKNIALDQTRKAYNNLNKSRMQAIGIQEFEWIHSGGGQKPRQLHIELSGQIFSFDDLPVIDDKTGERGIPGQAINCGCTMRPVVSFGNGAEDDDSTE